MNNQPSDEPVHLLLSSEDIKFLRQLKIDSEIKIMSEDHTSNRINIFDKYSEKAKRVLFFARYEASQLGSAYIGPEHILLGVLREDKHLVNNVIPKPGMLVDDARELIILRIPPHKKISTSIQLPFSNECKKVLIFANEEAEKLSHKGITAAHLLLGLLRVENSIASGILTQKGLSLSSLRKFMAVSKYSVLNSKL